MCYSEYLGDSMEPIFRIEQKKDTATGCLIFLHGTGKVLYVYYEAISYVILS